MYFRTTRHARSAFTLIELLVVISIISLLLSVLLPALAGARRSGQSVVCQTRLREIGAGMFQYGNDFEDWIVGSPAGSGAYITGSFAFGPCTQRWDFMGPIAKQMGISLPEDGGNPNTIRRFNLLRGELDMFVCPSNNFLAGWYGGPNAGVGRMVSYNTSRYMMFEEGDVSNGISTYKNGDHEESLPPAWSPRISKMGDVSKKVFCADGARYSNTVTQPDYDLAAQAQWGGSFSDTAPYSTYTKSWDRSGMLGGSFDARFYAFRHSMAPPRQQAPANAFQMNLVFMDGHVERMGDLESANPYMWMPAGSKLKPNGMYEDVRRRFNITADINIGS